MTAHLPMPAAAAAPPHQPWVYFDSQAVHPEWDAFVEAAGGHHTQTSLWAAAKSVQGWRAVRVIATRAGAICAGAQMLVRPLGALGAVGYVSRGPVGGDSEGVDVVLGELHRLARSCRVRLLAVQPPAEDQERRLSLMGYRIDALPMAQPTATLLLDLGRGEDAIWAGLQSKTRYKVALGQRRGVAVRRGTPQDLPGFWGLLAATGRRQGYTPEPLAYYEQLHRLLAPRGWIELFVAEYRGEPVSAALLIAFGDTVFYKRGAWSGQHGRHRPNEALQWEMIRWACGRGYRWYDFEGIDPDVARTLASGGTPDLPEHSVTRFKLGFGAQVALFPQVRIRVEGPLLRLACRLGLLAAVDHPLARRVLGRLRGGTVQPGGPFIRVPCGAAVEPRPGDPPWTTAKPSSTAAP